MGELLDKATDPTQYDQPAAKWNTDGIGLASPTRAHFWEYLRPYVESWRDLDVVDIGAGTGWFSDQILEAGARSVLAIEPSSANIKLAHKHYPRVQMVQSTLEDFKADRNFDRVVALLSFVHVRNPFSAMKKISEMLAGSGELLMVVPDFEYFRKPRVGRKIVVEEVDADEYVAAIEREQGTLVDITRSTAKYSEAATQAGMHILEDKGLPPTEILMKAMPKYREQEGQAMSRLLRYSKQAAVTA